MKSDYRVRAEKFIRSIFKVIEDNLHTPYTISDLIYEYNWTHNRNIEISYGCSRVALITSDYVPVDRIKDEIAVLMKQYPEEVIDGYYSHLNGVIIIPQNTMREIIIIIISLMIVEPYY